MFSTIAAPMTSMLRGRRIFAELAGHIDVTEKYW
jgi:hypothetical protein